MESGVLIPKMTFADVDLKDEIGHSCKTSLDNNVSRVTVKAHPKTESLELGASHIPEEIANKMQKSDDQQLDTCCNLHSCLKKMTVSLAHS